MLNFISASTLPTPACHAAGVRRLAVVNCNFISLFDVLPGIYLHFIVYDAQKSIRPAAVV